MARSITFEMKLGAGFLGTILAAVAILVIAIYGLNESIKASHSVITDYAQDLILAGKLQVEEEMSVDSSRGFLITGDKRYLGTMKRARAEFMRDLALLQKSTPSRQHDELLASVKEADRAYQETLAELIGARSSGATVRDFRSVFEERLQPQREAVEKAVDDYTSYTRAQLESERIKLTQSNRNIFRLVLAASLIALLLAAILAVIITRTVSRLYAEIRTVAQMREEVVETLAHDLRNPIAAIKLSTQLLQRTAKEHESLDRSEVLGRAGTIQRATDRMNGLISGLLELTKLKAGTLALESRAVDVKQLLGDVYDLFENIAREREIILEMELEDVPPVQGDYERIIQVFSNLIGNALKFTPPGKRISFGGQIESDRAVFHVSDQGSGIAETEQAHVFERYWQAGSSKKGGTGLGLAICKAIVRAHGGEIWLKSKPGTGTTFYFSIPLGSATQLLSSKSRIQNEDLTQ